MQIEEYDELDSTGFVSEDNGVDCMTKTGFDSPNQFKPIHIIGEWENERWKKRITVAILMPSGIGTVTNDQDVRVVQGGNQLEFSVKWPRSMTDPDYLHQIWTKNEDARIQLSGSTRASSFRPIIVCFAQILRSLLHPSTA